MVNIAYFNTKDRELNTKYDQIDHVIQEFLNVIENDIMPYYQNRIFDQYLLDTLKMRIYMAFLDICPTNHLDDYQFFKHISIELSPNLSCLEIYIDHDGLCNLIQSARKS